MQEKNKKAPSYPDPLQGTPLRDIMEKDEAWENTLSHTDRLALAYLRLVPFFGWWDADILGHRPGEIGADHRDAILDIVGKAEVSRFEKMEVYGWTYDQWLRWYTVERVEENRAAEDERFKQLQRERHIGCAVDALLIPLIAFGVVALVTAHIDDLTRLIARLLQL